MTRSPLALVGAAAAVVIVAAALFVRTIGPADPAADVSEQRRAVARFHALVVAGDWPRVYEAMTEPPARDVAAFAEMMRDRVRKHGRVERITTGAMRLLRSRSVPLLEVEETLRTARGSRAVVSYYARRDGRWLFAFSAPRPG